MRQSQVTDGTVRSDVKNRDCTRGGLHDAVSREVSGELARVRFSAAALATAATAG